MSEATARRIEPQPAALRAPELTVVIPTLNERENVAPLLERLDLALAGTRWEVIFVDDDSTDGTPDLVRAIGRTDPRVRCLHRIGRRGLSTACIEGVLASASPFVAVMDADLQHDEALLPGMLNTLRHEPCDIVVGSRYVDGGGIGDWDKTRAGMSGLATRLSRLICKTEIADPMSGFFMLRRDVFESTVRDLSGQGFKILLDLLASLPAPPRLKELPYQFRARRYGESKLDTMVAWEFGMLLADKLVGHIVPVRFALFALIGVIGVAVDLVVLWAALAAGAGFVAAQAVATVVAMTSNFFLNNVFTYRDQRLTGWRLWRGLFSFYVICSLGAVANVGFAAFVFGGDAHWLGGLAGIPWLASLAGVVVGSVWNYAVSSVFTWKRK
ncbi:MAG: glycosyltransferase family 2 protein [Alphaproteobacteria bacterium]|nr:glycosyltransferase family 2 protein [Alphaproteobacteria bacterium]